MHPNSQAVIAIRSNGVRTWLVVARSSLEHAMGGETAASLAASVAAMLADIRATANATQLAAEHRAAWAQIRHGADHNRIPPPNRAKFD